MTFARNVGHALLFVTLLGLLFPERAFAYLDPGTGSLFIQSVIATLAAAGYAVRVNWHRLQRLFRKPDAPIEPEADH